MNEASRCDYLMKEAEKAQRAAVLAREPLVVVGAGAGTGKTRTLAWRFCWLVASGRARATDILTLTFTEKAAREMEDRIRSTLEQWERLALDRKDESVSERLREARESADQMTVSTIHAFAYQIVRKSGLFLPDRQFDCRVVSPPEEAAFWADCSGALDAEDLEWFSAGLSAGWQGRECLFSEEPWRELVDEYTPQVLSEGAREAAESFVSRGLNPEKLWEWGENPEIPDRRAEKVILELFFPDWVTECSRWMEDILPALDLANPHHPVSEAFCRLQAGFSWPIPSQDVPFFLDRLSTEIGGITRNNRHALYQEAQQLLSGSGGGDTIASYRNDLLKRWGSALAFLLKGSPLEEDRRLRRYLLKGAALIWKRWEDYKRRENLVSFADQIELARQGVASHPQITGRFTNVLVDEFQDTDRRQNDLIRAIIRHNKAHLLVVGDLKQSIYRFRYADFSLFGRYVLTAQRWKRGLAVYLDRSFRSTPVLLDEINSLFAHLWRDGLSYRIKHDYRPLEGALPRKPIPDCLEMIFILQPKEPKRSVMEFRDSLARALGTRLIQLQKQGELSWRDMAVLCPTRNSFSALEKILVQEMNLPVSFISNVSYFRRSETGDAVALLRFLADRNNTLSLAGFLSSPFSLIPLDQVQLFLKERRKNPGEPNHKLLRSSFPELADRLDCWEVVAALEGPAAVLTRLLTDMIPAFRSYPVMIRRRAYLNICRAIDITREYQEVWGKDLAGCASYLEQATRLGERREEVVPVGETEDVMRVMTIHAAKGLEFPVVAVFGLENDPVSISRSALLVSPMLGLTSNRFPSGWANHNTPLTRDLHRLLEARDEEEERQRLFYVACTRAQQKLYLCGVCQLDQEKKPQPPPASALAGLTNWLEQEKKSSVESWSVPLSAPEKTFTLAKQAPAPAARDRSLSPVEPGAVERISATSYALFRFCPYAWRLRFRQGVSFVWEMPAGDGIGGPDLGSVVHWVLSRWDFEPSSLDRFFPPSLSPDETSQVPEWLIPLWPKHRSWEEARSWLETLSRGETGQDLLEAHRTGNLQREVPFQLTLAEKTKCVGTIDALIQHGDTIQVLDYKITRLEKAPVHLIQDQLAFYGLAVHRFNPNAQILLEGVFLREGTIEHISRPSGWESLKNDVLAIAHQASRGPFLPHHDHCSFCPWQKRCRRAQR